MLLNCCVTGGGHSSVLTPGSHSGPTPRNVLSFVCSGGVGGVGGGWQGLILERVFLFTVVVCLKERDISISDKHSVYIYIYIYSVE